MADSDNISDPVVRFYAVGSAAYWDASTITTRIVYEYGRNRPFAYAEVDVKKAYFNSTSLYWSQIGSCPTDSNGNARLPEIILGRTNVHIEAYGQSYDMIVDDTEDTDDYITFKCYNKAYKLRSSIYLATLCDIGGTLTFKTDDDGNEYPASIIAYLLSNPSHLFDSVEIGKNRKFSITYQNVTMHYRVGVGNTLETEYIEGTPSNIFRFIVVNATDYTPAQCIVDGGYSYDYRSEGNTSIVNSYEESEIVGIKASPVITGTEDTIRLRVNYLCWDIIKALGYLTNRWAFFYDYAYFVDYNGSPNCTTFKYMNLDYGQDENGQNLSYTIAENSDLMDPLDILQIVDSKDQGTTYVQTSQKVLSENHSETVSISDSDRTVSGTDVTLPYPEAYEVDKDLFTNSDRDEACRKLAFEKLVSNYHPLDCIQFSISEVRSSLNSFTVRYIVTDEKDLPTSGSDLKEGVIGVVTDGLMKQYFVYTSGKWVPYRLATYSNVLETRFGVYCAIDELNDVQNNIHMVNAPLAYTQRVWPACVTVFAFGNPEFIDSAYQLSALETNADNSVTIGLADFDICDSQAAKIVVGNQTLSQLYDNREGFTGLIMEKNRDKELYRLAGYDNGELQAFFDSRGRIFSGNAKVDENGEFISGVMIDHDGIAILGNKEEDQGYSYVPYEVDPDGNINFTNGNLYTSRYKADGQTCLLLGPGGLVTYSKANKLTAGIDAETGRIFGTTAVFANTAGNGYVVIDDKGLRTYSTKGTISDSGGMVDSTTPDSAKTGGASSLAVTHNDATLQCSVGTNGAITAGQGRVVLDRLGLRTFSEDYNKIYKETYPDGNEALSDEALKAVNAENLQCFVGTDGTIIAGPEDEGRAVLSRDGLTIYTDGNYGTIGADDADLLKFVYGTRKNVLDEGGIIEYSVNTGIINDAHSAIPWFITYPSMGSINYLLSDFSNVVFNGDVYAIKNNDGTRYLYSNSGGTRWCVILSKSSGGVDSLNTDFFMITGGFDNTSNNAKTFGATNVTFPYTDSSNIKRIPSFASESVFGALVSTDRGDAEGEDGGQSDRGSNYVRNLGESGMIAIHDQSGGFYWMAWGLVDTIPSGN